MKARGVRRPDARLPGQRFPDAVGLGTYRPGAAALPYFERRRLISPSRLPPIGTTQAEIGSGTRAATASSGGTFASGKRFHACDCRRTQGSAGQSHGCDQQQAAIHTPSSFSAMRAEPPGPNGPFAFPSGSRMAKAQYGCPGERQSIPWCPEREDTLVVIAKWNASRLLDCSKGRAKPCGPKARGPYRFRQAGLPAQGCIPFAFPSLAHCRPDSGISNGTLTVDWHQPSPITAARPRWNPRFVPCGGSPHFPFGPMHRLVRPDTGHLSMDRILLWDRPMSRPPRKKKRAGSGTNQSRVAWPLGPRRPCVQITWKAERVIGLATMAQPEPLSHF